MRNLHLRTLFDQDQRIDVTFPDMRREVLSHVVRLVDGSGVGEGLISYSQLTGVDVDAVIDEQIAYFERLEQDFEWKVYDYDTPSDLKTQLEARGFSVEEAEAVVVLALDCAPSVLMQTIQHDVRRIVEPTQLIDVEHIEQEVYDEDASWVHDFLGGMLRNYPNQMSVYVAYVDGEPASCGWTFFGEGSQFGSLWGGSTVERFRKQGLYTALLAVRAQEAMGREVNYLTVDASPMSRPILEKFGFEMIATTYPCKWRRKTTA